MLVGKSELKRGSVALTTGKNETWNRESNSQLGTGALATTPMEWD